MSQTGKRAKALYLLVVLLIGGYGAFFGEYLLYGAKWVAAEGNPHGRRGIVVDARGVLLRSFADDRYADSSDLRRAVVHWVGDRAGNIHTPVLDHYKSRLLGFHPLTGIYGFGGQSVATLTLSSKVQLAALEAMGDRNGVIAVYNYKTGAVLCALSTPGIDPEGEDSNGEGRYLNRFLQGVYTPGSVFKTVTAGAALEYLPNILQKEFVCTGKVDYGNGVVTCEKAHGKLNLYGAMRQSCNCAFAKIADQVGKERLQAFIDRCGVTGSITFDGTRSAWGNVNLNDTPVDLAWAGIGQHKNTINPAAFLSFMGAVANGGRSYRPYIMERIEKDGRPIYQAKQVLEERRMSSYTATELTKILRNNVKNGYGDTHFPGLTVCAKTGTAQVGSGKKATALFAGFVSDEAHPLAFFVAVEEGGYGRSTCIPIMAKVLAACRAETDK